MIRTLILDRCNGHHNAVETDYTITGSSFSVIVVIIVIKYHIIQIYFT